LSQYQKEIAINYLKSYLSCREYAFKDEKLLYALDLICLRIMIYEYFRAMKIKEVTQLNDQFLQLINWTGELKNNVGDFLDDEVCFWRSCYVFYM
jgi:hypothetical protein